MLGMQFRIVTQSDLRTCSGWGDCGCNFKNHDLYEKNNEEWELKGGDETLPLSLSLSEST